jgi:serine/threonine protein phosphatase PrpC
VTRALGAKRTIEVEAAVATVQPGDALLLCTAGLHGVVGHEDLAAVLAQHAKPAVAVEELLAQARALGAPDDVTAAVVRWEA